MSGVLDGVMGNPCTKKKLKTFLSSIYTDHVKRSHLVMGATAWRHENQNKHWPWATSQPEALSHHAGEEETMSTPN